MKKKNQPFPFAFKKYPILIMVIILMGHGNIQACIISSQENDEVLYENRFSSAESFTRNHTKQEEQTETDQEIPQKSPIIPILSRRPALHQKRQEEGEENKSKRLPWK